MLFLTSCPRAIPLGSLPTCCQVVRGILRHPHQETFLLMACPLGKWLKCERFYALWTLRCIPGGRTEAPQVIETQWIWFGGLRSVCFSMKIISWNARGLGSRNKRRVVKDFLRSENLDVAMIQETKKEKCDKRLMIPSSFLTLRRKICRLLRVFC